MLVDVKVDQLAVKWVWLWVVLMAETLVWDQLLIQQLVSFPSS